MDIENPPPDIADPSLAGKIGELASARWSRRSALDWYDRQPWPCGFNYLPASAVNFVEMWQEETFDPGRIDRELSWAAALGLNALRTNLPFVVWEHGRDGLVRRLDMFLSIADRHGLKTMLCLLDDCEFSGRPPRIGSQPSIIAGVHNGGAVGSPGRALVTDRAKWPGIERYIRDIVGCFRTDDRISLWDVYNEPGNRLIFSSSGEHLYDSDFESYAHCLLMEAMTWCRDVSPSQPLTAGAWRVPPADEGIGERVYTHPTDIAALEISDVVTFHAYTSLARMKRIITELSEFGRPLLCTEWMARQAGSTISEQLPLFRANRIGAIQWGLVNGRTQTHLPWPKLQVENRIEDPQNTEWFHDLLHSDGRPYSTAETRLIRSLTRSNGPVTSR